MVLQFPVLQVCVQSMASQVMLPQLLREHI